MSSKNEVGEETFRGVESDETSLSSSLINILRLLYLLKFYVLASDSTRRTNEF